MAQWHAQIYDAPNIGNKGSQIQIADGGKNGRFNMGK